MRPPLPLPLSVIDRLNVQWYQSLQEDEGRYAAYGHSLNLPDRSYADLLDSRGPLRPVELLSGTDHDQLERLFDVTARRTITTLAAALAVLVHEIWEANGGRSAEATFVDSADSLHPTPGQTQALLQVAVFGDELNRAPRSRYAERPHAPTASPRVDTEARDQMTTMMRGWINSPARYIVVPTTLAAIVTAYCDTRGGLDGWKLVADAWLQPRAAGRHAFRSCYQLFYALSDHFDPSLL